ncbi:glycosyltransferase family 4 protein [Candidatus Woesearchaeota archaeon]|nr:glycosyltransferase family 4 protein [Candidatus Woesearchaeota archaeon]
MRIAMIGLRGIPAKSGGVENVVEHLAPLLVKLGCDVTVYCRNPYCKERPKEFKGVKLRYLPSINIKIGESISHSTFSTGDAIFRKYDIVHYHAMANGLFSFIPRIIGKKTVVTLHGLDYEREKWGMAAKAWLRMCEWCASKFPDKVISVSEKIMKHFKKTFKKDIYFIPNGVETFTPKPIRKLKRFGLKKDNYILFLSRIVPEKEVHTLIQAFKKTNTDLKLIIAGDATHTEAYLKQVKALAKKDKRIIFTGAIYGEEKIEAFSNARFFVLPSTIEGMPIVLLEAMSFGLCPLVSDIEENMDVVKDFSFSFKVRDANDLKAKLEYIIKNPAITKKKGAVCKQVVKKYYQWETIAKQTLQVYKEALK